MNESKTGSPRLAPFKVLLLDWDPFKWSSDLLQTHHHRLHMSLYRGQFNPSSKHSFGLQVSVWCTWRNFLLMETMAGKRRHFLWCPSVLKVRKHLLLNYIFILTSLNILNYSDQTTASLSTVLGAPASTASRTSCECAVRPALTSAPSLPRCSWP